jgi:hypothetical protein
MEVMIDYFLVVLVEEAEDGAGFFDRRKRESGILASVAAGGAGGWSVGSDDCGFEDLADEEGPLLVVRLISSFSFLISFLTSSFPSSSSFFSSDLREVGECIEVTEEEGEVGVDGLSSAVTTYSVIKG